MFNITITQDDNDKSKPLCYHIPRNTKLTDVNNFFKTLGFKIVPVTRNSEVFLNVVNMGTGKSHAWILLSGSSEVFH